MKDSHNPHSEKMFRDIPEWVQDVLRTLSREGYIYIGRTGVGLTYDFRHTCMKIGTFKAIDKCMEYRELEEKFLIELISIEGPRWVPYTRIEEFCESNLYQIVRHKTPSQ